MPARRRHPVHGSAEAAEDEARQAATRADAPAPAGGAHGPPTSGPLAAARLHRDEAAAALTRALGARAVTLGPDVYLAADAPGPDTAPGRRLLAHELTHVVQQYGSTPRPQLFTAAERPQIATDLAAMMAVVSAIAAASSHGDAVDMDALVRHAGGRTAGSALPGRLRSDDGADVSLLTLRYLFTRRAGLVDMRHFFQLMYISWFTDLGNAHAAARGATRRGVEHEQTSEATSRFAPEDLPSNALGAWTATQLAGSPQRDDLIARVRETLELCAPVDFDRLSPASQTSIVTFYAAQGGAGEPLNQNTTAVALIPQIPELAGTDRSFPFDLDTDDPARTTIEGPAFAGGVGGLSGDSEIRRFVAVQREEVLRSLPQADRLRLCVRLMQGWVSDDDVDAFTRLYRLGDGPAQGVIQAAVPATTLSGGQRIRLRVLYGASP